MTQKILPNLFVNFGAGVQSTALALMVIGRDPRLGECLPREFIFADTGDEPADLYPHVDRIGRMLRAAGHEFTIVRKADSHPSLSASLIDSALNGTSGGVACPPAFAKAPNYPRGIAMRRTCTTEWKVKPIEAHIQRRMLEQFGADKTYWNACQWLGYSADESHRAKDSDLAWRVFRYPLIAAGLTRGDCHAMIERSVYDDGSPMKPMRSACVFCPYHSRHAWERLARVPEDWARALALDDALEEGHRRHGRVCGMKHPLYLTPQGWRLRDSGFSDPRQIALLVDQLGPDDLECEHGVCGM